MKKVVETIIEGSIALIALYVVAHVAYEAGHKMAEAEFRYEELTSKNEREKKEELNEAQTLSEASQTHTVHKANGIGFLSGIGRIFSNGKSVLGRIIRNPDDQKIEMYVDGEIFRVDVKPRK